MTRGIDTNTNYKIFKISRFTLWLNIISFVRDYRAIGHPVLCEKRGLGSYRGSRKEEHDRGMGENLTTPRVVSVTFDPSGVEEYPMRRSFLPESLCLATKWSAGMILSSKRELNMPQLRGGGLQPLSLVDLMADPSLPLLLLHSASCTLTQHTHTHSKSRLLTLPLTRSYSSQLLVSCLMLLPTQVGHSAPLYYST